MQEMMYDPPTGWRYGFPKVYRPVEGETLCDTLERDGYPRPLADDFGAEHCRFWHATKSTVQSGHWDSIARKYVEHDTLPQTTFAPLEQVLPDIVRQEDPALASRMAVDVDLTGARWAAPANDNRKGDWMQTYTGLQFWPLDPRADEVDIRDIAHSLSMQCRYGGHSLRFYSVAEHSVHMARMVSPANAMWALLHDAAEAYLADVPSPLKRHLPGYKEAEARVMAAVCEHFDLPSEMPAEVHDADTRILSDEIHQNMAPMSWHTCHNTPLGVELQFWDPGRAEIYFLDTFRKLTRGERLVA